MTKRVVASLAAIFIAGPAFAAGERIAVSAGEHADYSRIAFMNGGAAIAVEQTGRTVKLLNIRPDADFDFAEVNDRRKAYRVLSARKTATTSGAAIELALNCDCTVRSMTLNNGKFVLDVLPSEGTPVKTAAKETPPSEFAKRAAERVGNPPSEEDILSVEQAHNQMVELLKQAARDGLITIKSEKNNASDPKADQNAADENAKVASRETIAEPAPAKPTQAEVDDHDAATPPAATGVSLASAPKAVCRSDEAFVIDGAAFEETPLVQITDLQAALAEETGAARDATLARLVDGYLTIGFGEEALALLVDAGAGDSAKADIARVVAEREIAQDSMLLAAENCRGAQALWQALAGDVEEASALYQRAGNAIELLPRRLRALVATRLAIKLIAAEAFEPAQSLYDIAMAASDAPGPDLEYVEARLAQYNENSPEARDALLEIAGSNSAASDDALLALADTYSRREAQPHEGFTEDIGALAKVNGSSAAILAEADAWAKLGNVDAALFLLESVAVKSPQERQRARQSAQAIFDDAFARGDDKTRADALNAFLKHKGWFAPEKTAPQTQIAGAASANVFGLPNLAFTLLDDVNASADKKVQQQKADAALKAGYPQDVIAAAAPYASDETFSALIVEANIAAGQHNAALAAAAALPEGDGKASLSARAAWLARSWASTAENLRALDPSLLDERSALQLALSAYKSGATAMPAAADAVLSESREVLANGVRAFFTKTTNGSALQRSEQAVETTGLEIQMIEEVLQDG
ncbi:MAG: hypothetical protein ACX939_04500 [Hyphococcus sp.]